MGQDAEFVVAEPHLIERRGREPYHFAAEEREGFPQGVGFECHDDFHAGVARHGGDRSDVAEQSLLIYYIIRCLHTGFPEFGMGHLCRGAEGLQNLETGEPQHQLLLVGAREAHHNLIARPVVFDVDNATASEAFVQDVHADSEVV